ncbi:SET and MYND domain-containing protein 4-like [Pollicipes pollicipes]|uniref:SET and MYND domain-containing protein 4-like n=1 Tax=Pollicipes pollicipes TaxID=41117 RepID=UPI0018851A48|nr:SET and MYND domain-containing protein 4-like [Pollicipes pollicipes]
MAGDGADFEATYKKLCVALSKQGQVKDLTKEFNSMRSDDSRVRFLLALDAVRAPPFELKAKLKCAEESNRLRAEGNAAYGRRGQEAAALELYTRAVLAAPADDGPALALALANRSAVLLSLGWLGPCLVDMRRALRHGYPQQLRPKLEQRLQRVRQEAQARSCPELAGPLDFNEDAADEDDERLVSGAFRGKPAPELESINRSMPSACAAVEVRHTDERGRVLVATRAISPGELLVVEQPYCAVLLPEETQGHCHHCCRWSPAPVGCLHCTEVRFCSGRCRAEAWTQYHAVECAIYGQLVALDAGQMALLAVRAVVVAGWPRLAAAAAGGAPDTPEYRSDDYQRVRQLVGNAAARPAADLFKRALMAVTLGRLLERSSLPPPGADAAERQRRLVTLSAELLRHLQTLPCNAHEVSEQRLPGGRLAGATTCQVGAAVLPVLSLTNHSCDPNVFRCYHGTTAVLRALRPIDAGGELLDNYGYHYALMERDERRRGLARQYYFSCACAACRADLPPYERIPNGRPRAICRTCTGDVAMCDHEADVTKYEAEVARAADELQQAVSAVLEEGAVDVKDRVGELIELLDRRVKLPWRGLNDAQEVFKMCFLISGDVCPDG